MAFLIDELHAVLEESSPEDDLSRASIRRLTGIYSNADGSLTEQCNDEPPDYLSVGNRRTQLEGGGSAPAAHLTDGVSLRRYPAIDHALRALESRKALAEKTEYTELCARVSAHVFPSGELSRNIIRWETSFQNLESKTLKELILVRKIELNEMINGLEDDDGSDD
jgi:hypothetical protein